MKGGKRIIVHFMHSPIYYYANIPATLPNVHVRYMQFVQIVIDHDVQIGI